MSGTGELGQSLRRERPVGRFERFDADHSTQPGERMREIQVRFVRVKLADGMCMVWLMTYPMQNVSSSPA